MKRIAIFLLALAAATTTLSAANPSGDFEQEPYSKRSSNVGMEWGLTASASYNTLDIKNSVTKFAIPPHMGYGAGLHMALKLGRFFAVQPEINYVHSKLKVDIGESKKLKKPRITTNTVDIPLLLSLRFGNLFRINAGPVFTVMNNCFYTDSKGEKAMFGSTKPTFGYSAGVALVLLRRYMIDARYVGYFKNSLHNYNGQEFDGKYQTISIKLGYIF